MSHVCVDLSSSSGPHVPSPRPRAHELLRDTEEQMLVVRPGGRIDEAFDIRDVPRHEAAEIVHAPRGQSSERLQISVELSWTHYRLLSKVHQPDARRYYLQEAVTGRWSTRELERQILTRHFERGLTIPSTPASELLAFETGSAVSVLRDPYVLEFLGLPDRVVNNEAELEQALIDLEQHLSFIRRTFGGRCCSNGFATSGRRTRWPSVRHGNSHEGLSYPCVTVDRHADRGNQGR